VSTLASRVACIASAAPERTAITDGERRASYGEFWAQAQAFSDVLRGNGLQRGDRVAIVLPNRIEAATACYGTWLAGGVVVPLDVQARVRDLSPWIRHCDARYVLHEQGHHDATLAIAELPSIRLSIALEEQQPLCAPKPSGRLSSGNPSQGETRDDANNARANDLALILYTSGTTGTPKGVMLSHANLLANAESVIAYLGLDCNDSVLSVLPFYYAYGASVLHTHLISGARIHLEKNLVFPNLIVEALAAHRITCFSGVPSTFALLLNHAELGNHDLSCLRSLTQAGGPMTPALTRKLRAALPHPRLFVMYGQTEATSRLTWLPPERLEEKLGSVGIPVDGVTLKIVRDDGMAATTGEIGEVWAKGPNVMLGYWNNIEATRNVLQDGWLRTGDLGHLDGDGYLFLAGRRSDVIKTGAHRVHPGDIEEAIAEFPGVIEAAVVGVDDEVMGQAIKAFVVVEAPTERGADQIKAHCRERLPPYKIPKYIEFVAALPRTASGKVRRVHLLANHVAS